MRDRGIRAVTVAGHLLATAILALAVGCVDEERPPYLQISEADQIAINRGLREKLSRLPFHLKWDTYVLAGELVRNVFLEGDLLLIETGSNNVWAMDRNKGVILWKYNLQFPLRGRPAVSPDLVYLVARDVVHAVLRSGGDVKWKKRLPFVQGSSPVANDGFFFVAAGDVARFYAFKEATQVPKLKNDEFQGSLEAIAEWFLNTGDYVRADPVEVTRGATSIVYLSSYDRKVYALSGSTGKVTWSYETGKEIITRPYVRGDRIFVGGLDHTLHCLNRYGGPPAQWLFPTGGPIETAPSGDDDFVYVRAEKVLDEYGLPEDSYLYAVEVKTGQERWKFRRGLRMLISGKNKVYLLREGNVLVILEKETGKFLAEFPLPDFQFLLTNDKDDVLYLATDRGFLYALQEGNPVPFR
ncbi:MAG: PQQ-like beta-propeller repeat protein [Planctomycetes bacterium]|jgi:outer membrane protein assembly factor BamB|nr:PQQ-like beta-propeller repeat protein [Planctomycetota bacterium]